MRSVASFLAVACLVTAIHGQCHQTELVTSPRAGSASGTSVSAGGGIAVVGSPFEPGVLPGRVDVSQFTGGVWVWETALPPSLLATPGDRFGQSVAVSEGGDLIAVGSPSNATNGVDAGLVTIYSRAPGAGNWVIEDTLAGIFPGGQFGASVALSDDRLAVGEPFGAFGFGTVNVYERSAPGVWTNVGFLTGDEFLEGFGWAVDIDEEFLLVGRPFRTSNGGNPESGAVVFYRDVAGAWVVDLKTGSNQAGAHFGWAVALDDGQAGVGSPDEDVGNVDAGGLYTYTWSSALAAWQQNTAITFGSLEERLGGSVSIDGTLLAAGCPGNTGFFGVSFGPGSGRLVVLELIGGSWTSKATNTWSHLSVEAGDSFGTSVGVWGDEILVGSPGVDGGVGAAFAYDTTTSLTTVDLGNALAGTFGEASLTWSGSGCGNAPLLFRVTGGLPGAPAYPVVGFTELDAPFKGGVLVPSIDTPLFAFNFDASGVLQFAYNWPAGAPSVQFATQVWFVDPGGPVGFAASNGVRVITPGDI